MTSMKSTRRTVLKTVGASAAGLSVASTGLVGGAAAASTPPGVDSIEAETSCDRVHWNYKDEGGSWDKKSPINVVARGFDVDDILDVAENESGWKTSRAWWYFEKDRYVYNQEEDYMMGPGNQPNDGYGSIATGSGAGGGRRYHARCYEVEDGVVAIQAHLDGEDHDAGVVSYREAELEVVELILNSDLADTPNVDTVWLDNRTDPDNDGEAHVLVGDMDSVNVTC
jgi:hypothetical protein